ncbi:MAG TPA: RidA family protein, partial [Planctomycetota bacterium]|nr:RidA family protein [Planctomycetota bacterium]
MTHVRVAGAEDIHVTAVPTQPQADARTQTRSLYAAVLERLDDASSLRIITERVYGRLAVKEAFLSARAEVLPEAGLSADGPVTYLEGAPVDGEALAGVHLTLVRPGDADVEVTPVRDGDHTWGFRVTSGKLRRVFLSGVHGLRAGEVGVPAADQARRMFERAEALLADAGLSYHNVVLTRIHLRRLLDWYPEFNAVRNPFYRKLG